MPKESHKHLVEYLLSCRSLTCRIYEKAFLWGRVEPDNNRLPYIRDSLRIQPFRGSNYQNARRHILRIANRLQVSKHVGLWYYYSLGKLIVYVSDAFTYPNNRQYGSNQLWNVREKDFREGRSFAGHPGSYTAG